MLRPYLPAVALMLVSLTSAANAQLTSESKAVAPNSGQDSGQAVGDSSGALPGVIRVGVATPLRLGGAVSAFAGYGFLGDILGLDDSHHQAAGQLAATLRLTDWIGFGVRLDGRYDKHNTSEGSDDGYVGDPRLQVRAIRSVSSGLALGAQLNLWFPGSDAPSLVADAISAEAIGMASFTPSSTPLTLSANVGFRLDNSSNAVAEPMQLSLSDRLALGLSESNAVLLGAGLSYRAGIAEVLTEATYEYYLGASAPPPSRSPLEAGAGVRFHVADNLQIQAYARARLTKDPIVRIDSPLVPVSPRFGGMAGLHVQFGGPKPRRGPLVGDEDGKGDQGDNNVGDDEQPPVLPAVVSGRVISGGAPISDAKITLTLGDNTQTTASTVDGDYKFEGLTGTETKATILVEIEGFKVSSSEISVAAGQTSQHDIELERILPPGSIKGVVRDFRGKPVSAKVRILPLGIEATPDADGVYTVTVAPGEYEVVVEHPNFRTQRKQVKVAQGTVTILNHDLQKP